MNNINIMHVAFSLAGILLAILLLAYLLKHLVFKRSGMNNIIKIVSSLALGTKERILLIETSGAYVLIGVTPSQMNTLHVFKEGEFDLSLLGKKKMMQTKKMPKSFQEMIKKYNNPKID